MQGVYQISFSGDKRKYIGSSFDCSQRLRNHLNDLRLNRHSNHYLQRMFNKYGEASFLFDVVEAVKDRIWLRAREQAWIIRLQTCNRIFGFNLNECAWSGPDWDSERGKRLRARYSRLFTKINGTLKARKRSSEASLRFYSDPEERRKQSVRVKEIGNRPSVILKKSQSMKKVLEAPEHRARLSRQAILAANDPLIRARRSVSLRVTLSSPDQRKRLSSQSNRAKTYQLINPDGESVTIHNLKEFCKINKFHYSKMCEAAKSKRMYKGWKSLEFDESSHKASIHLIRSNCIKKGWSTRRLNRETVQNG